MTNNTQIRTKRISFILALLVIAYVAVDTYLFTYHKINTTTITTPVIIGLVVKSYSNRLKIGISGCQSFRVKVIFLLASRLLASTTLIYLWVVVILLCAMMLCMVRMSVPAAACSVANVLRYEWNVMFLVIPAERIHSFIGICVQLRISPLNTKPFFSEL